MKKERKKRIAHEVDTAIIEENVAYSDYTDKEKKALRNFAINFNDILYNQNIKQDAFCEKIGISQGALSQYRNGKRFPESKLLYSISKELNVSIDYLFGLSKIKKPDDDFKIINHTTGLTDEAIKVLKDYIYLINNTSSLELKNILQEKTKIINFLISKETKLSFFSDIACYLLHDYQPENNAPIIKELNKRKKLDPDLEELIEFHKKKIEIKDAKTGLVQLIDANSLNQMFLMSLNEKLIKLKEEIKNDK